MYSAPPISRTLPPNFIRAGTDLFNDRRKGNAVGTEFIGIDIHLVLLDEPTDGRHFSNAWNGFELVAEIPILDAAQFGETALMRAVNEDVFVYPACTGRVRSDDRMDVRG
jgi:hypothetical protein